MAECRYEFVISPKLLKHRSKKILSIGLEISVSQPIMLGVFWDLIGQPVGSLVMLTGHIPSH